MSSSINYVVHNRYINTFRIAILVMFIQISKRTNNTGFFFLISIQLQQEQENDRKDIFHDKCRLIFPIFLPKNPW